MNKMQKVQNAMPKSVLVSLLVFIAAVFVFSPIYFINTFGQEKDLSIEHLKNQEKTNNSGKEVIEQIKVEEEPVKIVSIVIEEREINLAEQFTKKEDWFKGLKIKVENLSGKTIIYLSIDLSFRRPKDLKTNNYMESLPFNQLIEYGKRDAALKGDNSTVQFLNGNIENISLSEGASQTLQSNLLQLGYPDKFSGVQIRIKEVIFDDNTVWARVWYKRDPNNPDKFVPQILEDKKKSANSGIND